jgi:RHS repeat-associated protein
VLYYIQTDHLNRPQKITDASAAVFWDGVFDPLGNAASVTRTITNPLRFPGQYADTETSLAQNWFRDYDSTIGRYVESDPMGIRSGINVFAYAAGNPQLLVDPTGLWGAGLGVGGTAEAGAHWFGAGATSSLGRGVFGPNWGLPNSTDTFTTIGAFAGGPGWGKSLVKCPDKENSVVGAFIGLSAFAFITNAQNSTDISGPFKTTSLDVADVFGVGVQYSTGSNAAGDNIFFLSFSFKPGAGVGAAASEMNTNTSTGSGAGGLKSDNCGCTQ